MKKNVHGFLLMLLCMLLPLLSLNRFAASDIKMIPLFIGDQKLTVEVADTQSKWILGLMYRESIADNFGMLFVSDYEEDRFFWMKNCFISLDIIYLDANKQVINIHRNAPPCKHDPCPNYPSARPAQYVLELRANRAQELGIKPGDTVSFVWKH